MKIAKLKKLNEWLPDWVKLPFSPLIRRRLIKNPLFVRQYKVLERMDSFTEEQKAAAQLGELKQILIHAYHHTEYYHTLFDEIGFIPEQMERVDELRLIPLLTRQLLAENYHKLAADDRTDFYQVSTGGTSGKPVYVLMDKDAIYKEWAFVYHFWSKFGYDYKTDRLATLRGATFRKGLSAYNPLYREIRLNPFAMNRDNIETYVKRICRYQADFLYGYPSSIYNFCRLLNEKETESYPRFKAVFLISENLYPFQEEMIRATLGCPIAIFYGNSERTLFGERYAAGYQFNPLYGAMYCDEKNRPVSTGFLNDKMPLINYVMEDVVRDRGDGGFDVIGHRDCDVLYGGNGEQISMAAVNFHDDTFDQIENYQFIQAEPGHCILKIVPDGQISSGQLNKIEKKVIQKLGQGIRCEVQVTDKIELTVRGKYKMVIRRWEEK